MPKRVTVNIQVIGTRVVMDWGGVILKQININHGEAFDLAKGLINAAQSAMKGSSDETGKGPGDLRASFMLHQDRVIVDWGAYTRTIDVDASKALQFASSLITVGQNAERVTKGHEKFTKKEVEKIEEGIVSPYHAVLAGPDPTKPIHIVTREENVERLAEAAKPKTAATGISIASTEVVSRPSLR